MGQRGGLLQGWAHGAGAIVAVSGVSGTLVARLRKSLRRFAMTLPNLLYPARASGGREEKRRGKSSNPTTRVHLFAAGLRNIRHDALLPITKQRGDLYNKTGSSVADKPINRCYLVRSMGRIDRPGVLKPRSTVEGGDESVKDRARGQA